VGFILFSLAVVLSLLGCGVLAALCLAEDDGPTDGRYRIEYGLTEVGRFPRELAARPKRVWLTQPDQTYVRGGRFFGLEWGERVTSWRALYPSSSYRAHDRLLFVPTAWPWVVGGLALVSWVTAYRLLEHPRRHRPTGHCPTCGYDCRATPDRCPECGTVIVDATTAPA
jgi:hypothetical protein